jgi:hypothetical protein
VAGHGLIRPERAMPAHVHAPCRLRPAIQFPGKAMGAAMIVDRDRDLMKEAVSELARLKGAAEGPTRFLSRLYASALEEWAGRLGMDPLQLSKLVPMGDGAPGHGTR